MVLGAGVLFTGDGAGIPALALICASLASTTARVAASCASISYTQFERTGRALGDLNKTKIQQNNLGMTYLFSRH